MRNYPQYSLKDVFGKSFKEGGLTRGQLIVMYTHAEDAAYEKYRTQAIFNGCAFAGQDPEDLLPEWAKRAKKSYRTGQQPLLETSSTFPAFKHPDEYKDLSEEERKVLSEQMMQAHKKWAYESDAVSDFGKD